MFSVYDVLVLNYVPFYTSAFKNIFKNHLGFALIKTGLKCNCLNQKCRFCPRLIFKPPSWSDWQQKRQLHRKFLPHENYGDWKLRGPCRENLHYLWKRAVRIAGKTHDNYRTYNYHGVSSQFFQPFSIDSANFPCRDPAIPSPHSFQCTIKPTNQDKLLLATLRYLCKM